MESQHIDYVSFCKSLLSQQTQETYFSYLQSKILRLGLNKVPLANVAFMDTDEYALAGPKYELFEKYLSLMALPLAVPVTTHETLQANLFKAPAAEHLQARLSSYLDQEGDLKVNSSFDYRDFLLRTLLGVNAGGDSEELRVNKMRFKTQALCIGDCPVLAHLSNEGGRPYIYATAIIITNSPKTYNSKSLCEFPFIHIALVLHKPLENSDEEPIFCDPLSFQLYLPSAYKKKDEPNTVIVFRATDLYMYEAFRSFTSPRNAPCVIRTLGRSSQGLLFPQEFDDIENRFGKGLASSIFLNMENFIQDEVIPAGGKMYTSHLFLRNAVKSRCLKEAEMKKVPAIVAQSVTASSAVEYFATAQQKNLKRLFTQMDKAEQEEDKQITQQLEQALDEDELNADEVVDPSLSLPEQAKQLANMAVGQDPNKRAKNQAALAQMKNAKQQVIEKMAAAATTPNRSSVPQQSNGRGSTPAGSGKKGQK